MIIFPATDIIGGKAVRLTQGDYNQMTVYSDDPISVARSFASDGAEYLHAVDLDGAKSGGTDNFETVRRLIEESSLKLEIGGGIRDMETVRRYIEAGAFRVILGTAALTNPDFLRTAVQTYGEKIAVGVDLKDGYVAIRGWTELSKTKGIDFIQQLVKEGVKTVICTDISKDGAMSGTNEELYSELSRRFPELNIVASGGISDLDTVKRLADLKLYGAIVGKAIYTGALSLKDAIIASK